MTSNLKLQNGSNVAVIGGGPSGSLSAYFLLDIARRADLNINVDIYEAQDFEKFGPAGCNHCGGIISESLVQMLSAEGIILPPTVVQRGIDSYVMHTDTGSVRIHTPLNEKRIAAIYRGSGPLGTQKSDWLSFDKYLIDLAVTKGAQVVYDRVQEINRDNGYFNVLSKSKETKEYNLVVGAVGLNPASLKLFSNAAPKFKPPTATKTFICEFELGHELVRSYFGTSMHVFLLNVPRLKFAALIPKGNFVTLVMLGSEIDKKLVEDVMAAPEVISCFPEGGELLSRFPCRCYPKVNIGDTKNPFADGLVMVGDCAVSKLYKNGIGAAYIAAKAAASTAVLQGISASDFKKHYWPVCSSLNFDNAIGKLVFRVTDIIQKSPMLKNGILDVVDFEQNKDGSKRQMSTVLWDTFTGSAPYKEILLRTIHPRFWAPFIYKSAASIFNKKEFRQTNEEVMRTKELGRVYRDGEYIIRQDEPGDCLYVIQSGKVEVIQEGSKDTVKLAELTEEDFFGEMALFEHEVRSCSVKALGEVRVLTIDKKTLLTRIQSDPSLAFRMLEKMSRRIRELDHKISGSK